LYSAGTFLFLLLFIGASVPTSGANAMATKETPHLRVRIEPKLLARLEKSRQKSGRTLTGEIVERLEESFRRDDTKEHLKEMAQLVLQELRPELTPAHWAVEIGRAVELERLAAGAETEEEKNALLKRAAEIKAKVRELGKEEARIYSERIGSALMAKKDE
jgi:sugar/nucleoside kinase (ribokinase family)